MGAGPRPAIDPCGYICDLARTTVDDGIEFFRDTEAITPIRWYRVPADRPVLPVASFVSRPEWDDENGPFSGMFNGEPPGTQGPQWVPHIWRANPQPYPWETFTGHYCGTAEQWAGELVSTNPADVGTPGCCIGAIAKLSCACSTSSARVWFAGFQDFATCACCKTTAAVTFRGFYDVKSCTCSSATAAWSPTFAEAAHACTCSSATAAWSPTFAEAAHACVCSSASVTWSPTFAEAARSCVCGSTEVSYTVSIQSYGVATIAAAGSTQGTATPITTDVAIVTVSALMQGVILPSGVYRIEVYNTSASYPLLVYPPSGEAFSGGLTNAARSLGTGDAFLCCSDGSGVWFVWCTC